MTRPRYIERASARAAALVCVAFGAAMAESARAGGVYHVECVGPDGRVKWSDQVNNLVLTAGKNDALDKYLAGTGYTAAWYLGLIDATGYTAIAAGDTSAAHAGWAEAVPYSNATRPAVAWGAASAGAKASTAVSYTINAAATVKGCFLVSSSTKGGTAGITYSAGLFSGGDRVVAIADTLNVTYTASL